MSKEPKTLPQAIKIIVGKYGKSIVRDARMVNILNDMVSLEETVAIKTILRDVLKSGYGGKMLGINVSNEDYHLKIIAYSHEVSNTYGYKEVLVRFILYSIAYGIGICPKEPFLKEQGTSEKNSPKEMKSFVNKQADGSTLPISGHKLPLKTIIVSFIISLIAVGYGLMYLSSATDRKQFNDNLFSGNTFMNRGDYSNAVESYKEAYNGYNALNSDSYKKEALGKINELTEKLFGDGQTDNSSLLQAYQLTKSELQLDLGREDREKIEMRLNEIEALIAKKIEDGRNVLITNLSTNKGRLDENSKNFLLELLKLSPDDYWLNFIKKKSYE